MVKYRKSFLEEMKPFLPYFVEFSKDGSLLPKIYPEDCAVGEPNWRPIIMITNGEICFLQMMVIQKYRPWMGIVFYIPKRKKKELWSLIFFYHNDNLIFDLFLPNNKNS